MKKIYLNSRTNYGIETVDEFTQETGQLYSDFKKYVKKMVCEYRLSGMDVYCSSRATKEWRDNLI